MTAQREQGGPAPPRESSFFSDDGFAPFGSFFAPAPATPAAPASSTEPGKADKADKSAGKPAGKEDAKASGLEALEPEAARGRGSTFEGASLGLFALPPESFSLTSRLGFSDFGDMDFEAPGRLRRGLSFEAPTFTSLSFASAFGSFAAAKSDGVEKRRPKAPQAFSPVVNKLLTNPGVPLKLDDSLAVRRVQGLWGHAPS